MRRRLVKDIHFRIMNILHIAVAALLLSAVLYGQNSQHGTVPAGTRSGATQSPPLARESSASLPKTCAQGDEFLATDNMTKYLCIGTNTWTKQASVGSADTPFPVVFENHGTFLSDSDDFVWDATNHRLGLGNPAPAARLDILGGSIRLNTGTTGTEAFNLSGRVGIGFPVPYFTPTTNNSIIAFDVYPKGTPSNFTANTGVAWFDLCSTDVNLDHTGYECLRMGKFANGDAHVSAAKGGTGTVRNLDLQINGGKVGIGTISPAALLSVGSSSPFQINANGNITKLNNVTTNFPAVNAAGYLTNDGSGNFYYSKIGASSAVATYTATSLPVAPPVGTLAKISDGTSISDCASGSGTIARSCRWNGSAWEFSPVGAYVFGAEPGTIPAAATSYAGPGISTVAPSEGMRQYVVAKACQVTSMYMNLGEDQPATGSLAVTLRIASGSAPPADTGIAAIVPAGAPARTIVSDTVHTVDLAAGDLVSIKLVNEALAQANLVTVNFSCAY